MDPPDHECGQGDNGGADAADAWHWTQTQLALDALTAVAVGTQVILRPRRLLAVRQRPELI
jgi:hypothetical protein